MGRATVSNGPKPRLLVARFGGLALPIVSTLLFTLPSSASAQPSLETAANSSAIVVNKVVLTTPDEGPTRTYRATAFDTTGQPVEGAVVDIAGLSGDPDVRVATTPMIAINSTQSQATMTYPAPGSWVVVVRVHAPTRYVHLGSETITGVAPAVSAHLSPSRIALEAISPNLGKRLTALQNGTAVPVAFSSGVSLVPTADHAVLAAWESESLATNIAIAMLHLLGVGAWLLAVGSVALAGRAGATPIGRNLLAWITPRYSMLAGGGLVLVAITGVVNLQRSAPVGLFDGTIVETTSGRLYVGALAVKMGLVTASAMTSVRLGSALRREKTLSFASGSAAATSMFAAAKQFDVELQRLALRNVAYAALIVGCVNVMSQTQHLLR